MQERFLMLIGAAIACAYIAAIIKVYTLHVGAGVIITVLFIAYMRRVIESTNIR